MLAKFDPAWLSRDIDVFVQRHPDSAKLCGDLNGKVKLEVRIGEKTDGTVSGAKYSNLLIFNVL